MKKILFVIDKLELKYFEFNKLVTNFWIIKNLLEKNNDVYITINPNLFLDGDVAYTFCYKSYVKNNDIFYYNELKKIQVESFDVVLFRPDPPVDIDYINATYIFDFVKNVKVLNSPFAIRNFNEKLHSLYFNDLMSNSIVTSSLVEIEQFLQKYKQIILKPLNKCFGSGVMYLYEGDPNTRTIINTMTNNETSLTMVQEYIPGVRNGDIRVLTLGDKVLPYCVRKLPSNDDFKFNTHDDNFVVDAHISNDELQKFTNVAKSLNGMGIYMAGLDVIDGKIIEINVTSPCYFINEINNIYGIHLEELLSEYILTESLLSLKK